MFIENTEALKVWLTNILEPMCDADPAALAKYVVALVKKDKPESDLRHICIDQLEVFLQQETKSFVNLLFDTLAQRSYLITQDSPIEAKNNFPEANPVIVNLPACTVTPTQTISSVTNTVVSNIPSLASGIGKKEDLSRGFKKLESEKENINERDKRSKRSPYNRRSRSRSWDRDRNIRSREKDKDRTRSFDREDRRRRNNAGVVTIRRDRKDWRSGSRSPRNRSRSKSRSRVRSRSMSPQQKLRSPKGNKSNSTSPRSRSRSGDRSRGQKPNPFDSNSNNVDASHGDVDLRITSSAPNLPSVVSSVDPGSQYPAMKKRCQDYDEKGYCMRGDLCPFDHGADPVVLEDVSLPQVLGYPGAPHPNSQTSIPTAVPPPNVPIPLMRPGMPPIRRPPPGFISEPYNPATPSMDTWRYRPPMMHGPMGGPRMMRSRFPGPQRELISVPTIDNQKSNEMGGKRGGDKSESYSNGHPHEPPRKKMGFDYNRLGNRKFDPQNCSLELRKIPRGLNEIIHLNNHFHKFGKIVNIQVCHDGDPEAALITFSSHAEANAAYKSTEAVLNNRFIKVFWHSKDDTGKMDPSGSQANKPSVKERLGVKVHPNPNKVLNHVQPKAEESSDKEQVSEKVLFSGSNLTKTVHYNEVMKTNDNQTSAETKAKSIAAIQKNQEFLAAQEAFKKKQEDQKNKAVKMKADIQKRKQDLLDKQLQHQKLLIEKLEKGKSVMKPEERDTMMNTIKNLQSSIETLRNEISEANAAKTKRDAVKELLDAELDLYARQQEGGDTTELQKKVSILRKEAKGVGHLQGPPALGRARGGKGWASRRGKPGRGRGRGYLISSQTSLDKRPRRVLVSGYEANEKPKVLSHFAQYGELEDYICDDNTPSVILNFRTRKSAEVALSQGRNLDSKLLNVSWYTEPSPEDPHHLDNSDTLADEGPDEEAMDELLNEDVFLGDEDEEEDEDRSWRR